MKGQIHIQNLDSKELENDILKLGLKIVKLSYFNIKNFLHK